MNDDDKVFAIAGRALLVGLVKAGFLFGVGFACGVALVADIALLVGRLS